MSKMPMLATALSAAGLLFAASAGSANAQASSLTLCWAAWDPANALVELSKDFTAESGIEMKFEFVPWTSYADRFLNELNSGGQLCDVIIGDSQWIGGSAENGHYINLIPAGLVPAGSAPAGAKTVGARTEHLRIARAANGAAQSGAGGKVDWIEHLGDQNHLHVSVGDRKIVTLADPEADLAAGDAVSLALVNPLYFDASGNRIASSGAGPA